MFTKLVDHAWIRRNVSDMPHMRHSDDVFAARMRSEMMDWSKNWHINLRTSQLKKLQREPKQERKENPWRSWNWNNGITEHIHIAFKFSTELPRVPENITNLIPVRKPTFGLEEKESVQNKLNIKATWLGHACFLVELPARSSVESQPLPRGARILFDPVFSDRCSPSQLVGPKRYTPPPCEIAGIPEVDAIVISHNHYDHLDTQTIRTLYRRARMPHIFAPLGNAAYFRSLGVPESHMHILDWWDSRRVKADIPVGDTTTSGQSIQKVAFDVTCTPAQHFTGRGIFDRFKSLWASWVVEEIISPPSEETESAPVGMKVYFGGDTGYRAVRDGQDEHELPTCPAFKEIGIHFGGFDLAMIPIGAYKPREFMSSIHCAPQDSVCIFKDIRAKRAIGMHWGTWVLTTEDVLEPPRRLAEECKKAGIEEGIFSVCDIGETVLL